MKTYIVKFKHHERLFTDDKFAVIDAERLGMTGLTVDVFRETDGVREDEPFFSM